MPSNVAQVWVEFVVSETHDLSWFSLICDLPKTMNALSLQLGFFENEPCR